LTNSAPLLAKGKIKPLPPVLVALCIQFLAFIISIVFQEISYAWFSFNTPLPLFYVCQGLIAATLTIAIGMAPWWRYIQLIFPLAILLTRSWDIPSYLYLLAFLFSTSLFWSTFRTQVPFYPSRSRTWDLVANRLPDHQNLKVMEIGSGLGDFSMRMAQRKPNFIISGIEIAPLPWCISYLRGKFKKSKAKFTMGDYQKINFADFDVIFAYLSPAAMPGLWDKVSKEMHPSSLLISHEFDIPDVKPSEILGQSSQGPVSYLYQIIL